MSEAVHRLDRWIERRLWPFIGRRWRNTAWRRYLTSCLMADFGLVRLDPPSPWNTTQPSPTGARPHIGKLGLREDLHKPFERASAEAGAMAPPLAELYGPRIEARGRTRRECSTGMAMRRALRQMPAQAGRSEVGRGEAACGSGSDEARRPRHETGNTGAGLLVFGAQIRTTRCGPACRVVWQGSDQL